MKLQKIHLLTFVMVFVSLHLSAIEECNEIYEKVKVNLGEYLYRPYISFEQIQEAIKYPTVGSLSKVRVVCANGINSFEEIGTIVNLKKDYRENIDNENYMFLPNFFPQSQSSAGLLIIGLTNKNSSVVTMQFKKSL